MRQYHFHAPSEHSVDGELFAAEMHIVHQLRGAGGTDALAVVGILFEQGPTNAFMKHLSWMAAPAAGSSEPQAQAPRRNS